MTDQYVAKIEDLIRQNIKPADLKMIVSNIGVVPDFSALYTTNAGPYTATIQVALNEPHSQSSFDYMDKVRNAIAARYPEVRTFFSSGSMVDAILNSGMPAPIDVQVSSSDLPQDYSLAQDLADAVPPSSRGGRSLSAAGHELSRYPVECGPRPRRRAGPEPERCHR